MRDNFKRNNFCKSIGLVFVFVGMQFNTALKNVVHSFDFIEIIMFLSVLFLIDWRGLKKITISVKRLGLLFFQMLLLFLAILSKNGTTQLILFHIYLIFLIIAFCTHKFSYTYGAFGKLLFYFSGFISIVVCFQATNGFQQLIMSFEKTGKLWLKQGGDPVTMSRALVINLISILLYKNKKKIEKYFSILFIICDIIGLLSFSNRASIICSIIVLIFWCYKNYTNKLNCKQIYRSFLIVITGFFLICFVKYIRLKTISIIFAILEGIQTLLGFSTGRIDPSAYRRVLILSNLKNQFVSGNIIKNFFLGLGYNSNYVDRPIYQIFFDLGILGMIFYLYYIILTPLNKLFKYITKKDHFAKFPQIKVFVIFISIQTLMDQFYCGLPYYYYLWTPAIFLICSRT